ncbi:MAG: hypothetical protein WA147_05875 [Polaromonas sp.]
MIITDFSALATGQMAGLAQGLKFGCSKANLFLVLKCVACRSLKLDNTGRLD